MWHRTGSTKSVASGHFLSRARARRCISHAQPKMAGGRLVGCGGKEKQTSPLDGCLYSSCPVLCITFVQLAVLFTQAGPTWSHREDNNFPAMITNFKKNLISEAQEHFKHWHIDNPTWLLIWWRITRGKVLTRTDGKQKKKKRQDPRDKIQQCYFFEGKGLKGFILCVKCSLILFHLYIVGRMEQFHIKT